MIYDQHRAAFNQVSAYVVMHGADRVATVAIKYPRDGAGRLYAYVHFFCLPMVRGFAGGGGYDKRSAACADAAFKIDAASIDAPSTRALADSFIDALAKDDGYGWEANLRKAGFNVFQAV